MKHTLADKKKSFFSEYFQSDKVIYWWGTYYYPRLCEGSHRVILKDWKTCSSTWPESFTVKFLFRKRQLVMSHVFKKRDAYRQHYKPSLVRRLSRGWIDRFLPLMTLFIYTCTCILHCACTFLGVQYRWTSLLKL